MNLLEFIGGLSIFLVVAGLNYLLIVSPICTFIEAYQYNKKLGRLEELQRELDYYYDKMYMLTSQRFNNEKILKDKTLLKKCFEEYEKNINIVNEEINNKIRWVAFESDSPEEMSDRYYQAHKEINALKNKLGVKY